MRKKPLSIFMGTMTFPVILTVCGCQSQPPEGSEPIFTSIPPKSSSISSEVISSVPAPSSSEEAPAVQYTLEDVSFSDDPENPGSLVISYPCGMFSSQPVWMDTSHIYLTPGKDTGGFAVIADMENRTFAQAPAQLMRMENISYQDDCVYLVMNDYSIQKMDKNFHLLSSVSFGAEADNYVCTIHPASETLYYIQQDDPGNPLLRRKTGQKTETVTELPALGDREYYACLDISPSGGKLLFYKIYYEMLAKYIYVYDINTNTLTDITHHYENAVTSGFWMPESVWMGEQPVVLLHNEYSYANHSNEIRYGIPPETKVESFYNPLKDCNCSLMLNSYFPQSCITFRRKSLDNPAIRQEKILYFRDNETWLSYSLGKNTSAFYPQLSPDYAYLSFTCSLDELDTQGKIRIVPTENLWKPLDWQQVQEEMDYSLT